jgi:hypothetical protein
MPLKITEPLYRSGCQFICNLPRRASKIAFENDCLIADLDNGERFLVPIEAASSAVKN